MPIFSQGRIFFVSMYLHSSQVGGVVGESQILRPNTRWRSTVHILTLAAGPKGVSLDFDSPNWTTVNQEVISVSR